jgi:hypothetical protein
MLMMLYFKGHHCRQPSSLLFILFINVILLINWSLSTPITFPSLVTKTPLQRSSSIRKILDLKTRINKLTLHKATSTLYVASTNHLYKINDDQNEDSSSSLRIDVDVSTGPRAQKQQCAFITESSESLTSSSSSSESTETQSSSSSSFSSSHQCIKYICDEDGAVSSRVNNGGGDPIGVKVKINFFFY